MLDEARSTAGFSLRAFGVVLVCVLCSGGAEAADLNGFVFAKGKGGIAFSYTEERFDEFFLGDESEVADPGIGRVERTSLSVWVGYGVTDRLTLNASLPYVDVDSSGTGGFSDDSLQDLTVIGKYRVASLGRSVRSDFLVGAGLRTPLADYGTTTIANVGDHSTDGLFRFVYQLNYRHFYASQQVGFDLRSQETPNSVVFYSEAGAGLGRTFLSASYGKQLAGGGTSLGDPGFTFPGLEDESDRIGAKVYVRLTSRIGAFVAGHTTLAGKNAPDISGGAGGLFVAF